MENLITPLIKDDVLAYLVKNHELNTLCSSTNPQPLLDISGSRNNLQAIFDQFCRLGLMKQGSVRPTCYSVTLALEAHDLFSHGGFFAHEEILKANINKLGFELETLSKELEPKFAEKANVISTIAANVVTALGLFRF